MTHAATRASNESPMRYCERAAPAPGAVKNEFVLSDNSVDRVGDVIEQNWELENFKKNPIALFNHNRNAIIGKWADVRVEKNRLIGRLELASDDTDPLVRMVRRLIEQDILRATSVGFAPLEKELLDEDESDPWFGPFRFLKSELLEASLVAVPANANAIALARSLDLSPDLAAVLFRKPARTDGSAPRASTGKPAKSLPTIGKTMGLSQRIEAKRATLVAQQDRAAALAELDELDTEETAEADVLLKEIPETKKELARLEEFEKVMARGGAPKEAGAQEVLPPSQQRLLPSKRVLPQKKLEPIDYFFRAATCMALAKANRTQDPLEFVRERYRGDEENVGAVLQMVHRSAPGPALTSQATWAAEIVQVGFGDFLSTLKPDSIYPVLAARGPRFTFGPQAGTIKLPARSSSPTVAGAFVGEAQPIPVRKLGLTTITLSPFKMAVITMFSEEISNRSTPQIEALLRDEMTQDTSVVIDQSLIDNVAASTIRPAGLRNGVSGLTPTASGTNLEKMVADLKQLIGAIYTSNGGRDVVVILNPLQALSLGFAQTTTGNFLFSDSVEAGRKFNVTFVPSNTCPAGQLICVDAADFASATGDTPRFRLSAEAVVHDEDTTPLPISATGSPNTVAAPIRSFFQTDTMGIRLIWDMTWQMRRTGMVSWMTGVTW